MKPGNERQRILTGVQATGPQLHLGNFVGVLNPLVELQDKYLVYCGVMDLHALTTRYDNPGQVSKDTREITIEYLAAGIDPKKSIVFIQSHVPEHAELHLLLSMITPLGWLERVPTYKEKKQLMKVEREPYGLLGYPVLQAADILLYKPYGVPVGQDQAAHLEIAREIGRRFNHLYGDVFPEFKSLISETPTLLGTDGRKMSKSYDNCIYLADDEETTAKKISTSYTDPLKVRKDDLGHPEGCSIFSLHKAFNKPNVKVVDYECRGGLRGCVDCKKECLGAVLTALKPIRERRKLIDIKTVDAVLEEGSEKAHEFASKTMKEVKEAMKLF